MEVAAIRRHDMGGPGGAVHRKEKGVWAAVGDRGLMALGWPEGIVFFSIYSKSFQMELTRFRTKMVFPYSKNQNKIWI
jgi:hypothetical protein